MSMGCLRVATLAFVAVVGGAARAEPAQTTWTTYLYQGPGTHYSVIGEVPQATAVELGACADGWCRITYEDRPGFVMAEVVAKSDPAAPAAGVLRQPAAALVPQPSGPCFDANQKGGNGGNAMTVFCPK